MMVAFRSTLVPLRGKKLGKAGESWGKTGRDDGYSILILLS